MIEDLQEQVGRSVTLHGTALDARAGAIVLLADGTPVYLAGTMEWDEAMVGREVAVTGTLVSRLSDSRRTNPRPRCTTMGSARPSRSRMHRGERLLIGPCGAVEDISRRPRGTARPRHPGRLHDPSVRALTERSPLGPCRGQHDQDRRDHEDQQAERTPVRIEPPHRHEHAQPHQHRHERRVHESWRIGEEVVGPQPSVHQQPRGFTHEYASQDDDRQHPRWDDRFVRLRVPMGTRDGAPTGAEDRPDDDGNTDPDDDSCAQWIPADSAQEVVDERRRQQ